MVTIVGKNFGWSVRIFIDGKFAPIRERRPWIESESVTPRTWHVDNETEPFWDGVYWIEEVVVLAPARAYSGYAHVLAE